MTALLIHLYGLSAVVIGLHAGEAVETLPLVAGVILLLCSAAFFFLRTLALVLASILSVILLTRYAPGVLNPAEYATGMPGVILTIGGMLVLLASMVLLGGQSATSGEC